MSEGSKVDKNGIEFRNTDLEQYDYYDTDPIINSWDKYERRIGSILIEFSGLEAYLDRAISNLLSDRSDHLGYVVTIGMGYKQKVDLFNRLARAYLFGAKPGVLRALIEGLRSSGDIRNIVAHANWMTLTSDRYVRSHASSDKTSGLIVFKYYKLNLKALRALEGRISTVADLLDEFVDGNLA